MGINDYKEEAIKIENKINTTIFPRPTFLISKKDIENKTIELNRLVLSGSNLKFDQLLAKTQNLTFNTLEKYLIETAGINNINIDILKTLNLSDVENNYNIAGELFADSNTF